MSLINTYQLPLAPSTGNFLISDYEKYEVAREVFFDSPTGRVAGRSGGTVARLWRKNTSRFNERVNDILKGPPEEALSDGLKVYCGRHIYYDDCLPLAKDAFICGQYIARTGNCLIVYYNPVLNIKLFS